MSATLVISIPKDELPLPETFIAQISVISPNGNILEKNLTAGSNVSLNLPPGNYTIQAPTFWTKKFAFGNTALGTILDTNDANAQSVSYFTAKTTGPINDIVAYIDGKTPGNAIAALYAVNGNSAGALLAQSKPANIGTTFSWVDFQLPTPYTVTVGTTYGLAIMGNIPINFMIVSGTGQRDHNAASSYIKGFANPFGSIWGTGNNGAMSIFAGDNPGTLPEADYRPEQNKYQVWLTAGQTLTQIIHYYTIPWVVHPSETLIISIVGLPNPLTAQVNVIAGGTPLTPFTSNIAGGTTNQVSTWFLMPGPVNLTLQPLDVGLWKPEQRSYQVKLDSPGKSLTQEIVYKLS
jgi:hypothetical protein